jgi:aldose 1-epimerase
LEGLVITCGDSEARLFPQTGGAIGHWRWKGVDIFRPAPGGTDIATMASFPMLPYANRLGNAELPGFGCLTPNAAPERHGLHGIGWQRPWTVTVAAPDRAELTLRHGADGHWPFDFLAVMRFSLESDQLITALTLTNLDAKPMPAGAGFHPYFPIDADTCFDSDWRGVWEIGDDLLPTRHHPVMKPAPRLALGWSVNNCFTGWGRVASLTYAEHRVTVRAGRECSYLQCYQPGAAHPYIALEPVSHAPNAHQMRASASHGLRELGAGMSFTISMTISVEALPPRRQRIGGG